MIYRFADCEVDTNRHELRRGGEIISTEPQVFEVLMYLLTHRERVVSRQELCEQCWAETYVSDEALSRCLSRVRQALGQRRTSAEIIRTVRGKGYQMVAEVTELDASLPRSSPAASPEPLETSQGVAPAPPSQPPMPSVPPVHPVSVAERRRLTVLSCTFADLDPLVGHLDPEDLHQVLHARGVVCVSIINHVGGHVVQQLDTEVVGYFGYPQAYEDAVQRAIRAGLRMVDQLSQQADVPPDVPEGALAVRVGIHTGSAITETGARGEALAVGVVPRVAAALRQRAEAQTVVMSEATAALVQGYFDVKALGLQSFAGYAEPLVTYVVRGESLMQTRLEVGAIRGLTPFVGREADVALLEERWAHVQEGLGQVVLIRGEAGIGKSRLVQVLKARVADMQPLPLECRCSPYHQNTALYPVIDLVRRALRWQSDTPAAEKLETLEALVAQYDVPLAETIPFLAGLLSLEVPEDRYPPLTLTPQRQRQRTLETLLRLLLAQAAQAPVVLIVEDVHWADPSTLELLQLLMGQVATTSMLVVLTCRPVFEVPWRQGTQITSVVLKPLTRPQMEQMITHVAGGKPFPAVVMQQVVTKTDGVPLFVEEVTRMVVESGQLTETEDRYVLHGALTQLTIPATLYDSLLARLDRLGRAKEIAQWGAVLGREFRYEILDAVTPYNEATLQDGLGQLVEAELVFQRGLLPQAHYRFKHALVQDAAYDTLLKRRRQAMHRRIAEGLIAHYPETVETQPELVAHHYTEATLHEQAIPYWQQAGQLALQQAGYQEAVRHLTTALELLATVPESLARVRRECEVQMALGGALMATKGNSAPDVHRAYARARTLCQLLDGAPELLHILMGLWRFYYTESAIRTAREVAAELLAMSQHHNDPTMFQVAHTALGITLYLMGIFSEALVHLEQGVTHVDHEAQRALAVRYGAAPAVQALAYWAQTLWFLGYPEQAQQRLHEALALERALEYPLSFTQSQYFAARFHIMRREVGAAQAYAEALAPVAQAHGFVQYIAAATFVQGWVQVANEHYAVGIAQMQQGLTAIVATGARVFRPLYLSLLAEACVQGGHIAEGLQFAAEGVTAMAESGRYDIEAETYRVKAALLLRHGVPEVEQAEACLHQAIAIARRQQAKSLELRAATSLARLWQQQGKFDDAFNLLAPIYHWFTEGFDTVDVQEARALLAELA